MKIRAYKLSIIFATLLYCVALTPDTVKAADHSINSTYWDKTRKVIVEKNTVFRKYDKLRYRFTKGIKKFHVNDIIKLRRAGEFQGWVLAGTKSGSRYWWISTKSNSKWMSEYFKQHKENWTGNTYTDFYGNKFTVKKLERISVFNYDNTTNQPDEIDLVLTAKLSSAYKKIKPSSWLESSLYIYPFGTNSDHTLINGTEDTILKDDDQFADLLSERDDTLPKDYYTIFKIVLTGDDVDLNASSYIFDDGEGHNIEIPVTNAKANIDVED